MKLGVIENEFGTQVTQFKCEFCGFVFTVCPAVSDEDLHHFHGCLATACESYDESRDIDKLWGKVPISRRPVGNDKLRGNTITPS